MGRMVPLLCLMLLGVVAAQDDFEPSEQQDEDIEQVNTFLGSVRGKKYETSTGQRFYRFLGIPYAQPPLKHLRFMRPRPVQAWGVRSALREGAMCPQVVGGRLIGDEDCLHLNIFTPSLPGSGSITGLKPVMFWIHGGSFVVGSGGERLTSPLPFMDQEVVVVSINYRLGPLGFLTFGNEWVSGNMGLWDQLEAIRWTKNNIHYFGGDPTRITVFGEDAGGESAHAHVLSPQGRGVIAGAISQSGTMLHRDVGDWKRARRGAIAVAEMFNCSSLHLDIDSLSCLQEVDVNELIQRTEAHKFLYSTINWDENMSKFLFEWGPVVDSYSKDSFLPSHPLEILKSRTYKKIPFMTGTVKNEGSTLAIPMYNHLEKVQANWDLIGPIILRISNPANPSELAEKEKMLANIVKKFYVGKELNKDDKIGLTKMLGDSNYLVSDQKTVQMMSQGSSPVYNYHFTHKGSFSLSTFYAALENLGDEDFGVVHGDDLLYLFQSVLMPQGFLNEDDKLLAKRMVTFWTNFAKFGDPSPFWTKGLNKWTRVDPQLRNYMDIKVDPQMKQNLEQHRMKFWDQLIWSHKQH